MLILVSGQHPILGTQILYFSDPVLAKRAAVPPPAEFQAIDGERLIDQPPSDRTRNLVSRGEQAPASTDDDASSSSAMEDAFLAALADQELPGPDHQEFLDQLEERRASQSRPAHTNER